MNRVELNGRWEFRGKGKGAWLSARVPGSVHGDLLRLGRIPDPHEGLNELDVLWVGRTDWEYRRTFRAAPGFLRAKRQVLVCEGLDTVATVYLNGRKAGEPDNMFRRFVFDAAPFLKAGENEIRIVFRSPVREAERRAQWTRSALRWPKPPVHEPFRVTLRKAQYHSGWDWGACLATSGVWKDIRLLAYDAPRIVDTIVEQEHLRSGAVRARVKAWLDVPAPCQGRLVVSLGGAEDQSGLLRLRAGQRTAEAVVTVEKPQLWWPAGQGRQHLHDLAIEWRDEDGSTVGRVEKRIGLRTIDLVRESDQAGESFYFRVNGRPVFCKGADWIPGDLLLERMTRDKYERNLRAAAAANMNMLRVWGGGIYEKDEFYDLCDELGLMVWQDFMFACGLYPGERWFLDNVEGEARHQVRRLHDHPSIVLWCGNNENEEGVRNWWKDAQTSRTFRDYERLYRGTLGRVAAEEDPGRPYWPSSPSNGGEGNPRDPARGDVHYWAVWHGGKRIGAYETIRPRFCSEFGFQSFPCLETLKAVARPEDMNPCSPVMDHHQRSNNGNKNIIEHMSYLLRFPFRFDDFCYCSQVQQAVAIQTAVEHWRRLKPHCMGTLYWQLNDCWPVASWASIDYAGRWKALHHAARRFYAPLLASSRIEGKTLELWATSDLPAALTGKWKAEVWTFRGRRKAVVSGAGCLGELESRAVARIPLSKIFADGETEQTVFVVFELKADSQCLSPADRRELGLGAEAPVSQHTRLFAAPKAIDLEPPGIRVRVEPGANGQPRVRLRAEKPALFVELSTGALKGVFSDNWMHLAPGREVAVEFAGERETTSAQLKKRLRIRTLYDSYQE